MNKVAIPLDEYENAYRGVINVDSHGRDLDAPSRRVDRGEPVAEALETISAASFEGQAKPCRRFLVPDLIPDRNVTILSGDGGTGKSLLAMQLGVAVSAGIKWLAIETGRGGVLYFSAEDDEDECHIRLKDICEGDGIPLPSSLRIAIMAGEDCLLATENAKTATMDRTALYARLEASIRAQRPALVVLDNVADIFGGNENVKGLVRQFIGMMRRLAITYDCAVLLLAHPSLSGMASGTGTSGNTAWNNSVRSRLYLKRQHDDLKEITDPDFRKLVSMKSNYGPAGGEIGMRWEHGRFIPTDTPAAATGTIDRAAIASRAERVFLTLVHRFNEEGRNISPTPSRSHAPLLFANHPQAEGVTRRQFEVAMDTLLAAGSIKIVNVGPPSHQRKNIIIAPSEGEE
jgi:RecA-family ATPase